MFRYLIEGKKFNLTDAQQVINLERVKDGTITKKEFMPEDGLWEMIALNEFVKSYRTGDSLSNALDYGMGDLISMKTLGKFILPQCKLIGCEKPHDKVAETTFYNRKISRNLSGLIGRKNNDVYDSVVKDIEKIHLGLN